MAHEGAKSALARSLRERMTFAERRLWSRLRKNRFHGLRWLRQEPFGKYIVDFYCPVARIVIELDGDAHAYQSAADVFRQAWLEEQGIRVLRFPNSVVVNSLETVLEQLYVACQGNLGRREPE